MNALFGLIIIFLFTQVNASETTSIKTFKLSQEVNKSVLVEGVVEHVYQCPPCPPQAMCKPCDRPNFSLKDATSTETIKAYIHHGSTLDKEIKEGMDIKIFLHKKDNGSIYALATPYPGEAYYQALRQKCSQKSSDSCCLSSVSNMQMIDASEAPKNGCPLYSTLDTLKCKDSFIWCY